MIEPKFEVKNGFYNVTYSYINIYGFYDRREEAFRNEKYAKNFLLSKLQEYNIIKNGFDMNK